jgi:hypothetical protein
MSTVFVTLCDEPYFSKALQTIEELRTIGRWSGDVVLLTVGFDPGPLPNVNVRVVPQVPTEILFEQFAKFPFRDGDGRHLTKPVQWNKFHVFADWVRAWDRVVFLDAGMRVLGPVAPFLELDCTGRILAPDDTIYPEMGVRFSQQLERQCNPDVYAALLSEYSESILSERYFVDAVFLFDTAIIEQVSYDRLVETMNKYPICLCNEMTILNLLCSFRYRLWTPLPRRIGHRYTFAWNESPNNGTPGEWYDFHFMKYPCDIPSQFCVDPETACVTLCDEKYFTKAKRTINELRKYGAWAGDIVLLAVDFDPGSLPGIHVRQISHINTQPLLDAWKIHPLEPMPDNRHYNKLTQWDKLQVFDSWFCQWKRVIFLDAGMRIFDTLKPLLDLPWEGKFLAPDDSDPYDNGCRFRTQVELSANPPAAKEFIETYSEDCLNQHYFLNCFFIVDTALFHRLPDLTELISKYPFFRCNEMGLMNLVFTIQLGVWSPLPQRVGDKYLFAWSEANYREHPDWRQFHMIKYSMTHA